MKKLIIFSILVLTLFSLAPVNPPRLVRLEVVNKAGEPVYVELQGLGYDFKEDDYAFQGAYYYLTRNGPQKGLNGEYLDIDYTSTWTILKDRYVVNVIYPETELYNSTGTNTPRTCLNNWTSNDWKNNNVYFDAIKGGENPNRIVVFPCDQSPPNIGDPGQGALKYYRFYFMEEPYVY